MPRLSLHISGYCTITLYSNHGQVDFPSVEKLTLTNYCYIAMIAQYPMSGCTQNAGSLRGLILSEVVILCLAKPFLTRGSPMVECFSIQTNDQFHALRRTACHTFEAAVTIDQGRFCTEVLPRSGTLCPMASPWIHIRSPLLGQFHIHSLPQFSSLLSPHFNVLFISSSNIPAKLRLTFWPALFKTQPKRFKVNALIRFSDRTPHFQQSSFIPAPL